MTDVLLTHNNSEIKYKSTKATVSTHIKQDGFTSELNLELQYVAHDLLATVESK